jgi:phage terminase large subunit-like protein
MGNSALGVDPEIWKAWDQKSKDKFLERLEASEKPKRVWYCTKGRECDGKPHDVYDYPHARGDQWPPEGTGWLVWLLKGGRGSGKTRSGAEWIRNMSKTLERVSIIGPSWSHVRDTMVEGDSGLLVVFENAKQSALWEPSKRKLTVPCGCKLTKYGKAPHRKGHFIQAFTGEEPERLRGPQHAAVWLDEPAHFALIEATWDNMMFGLRLGKRPVVLCSTTPLPTKWMKELIKEPDTISVTVSTYANMDNLAPTFRKVMLDKYEGTRLGRQELHGEVLEDVEGALWNYKMIEPHRVQRVLADPEDPDSGRPEYTHEDMDKVVVGIDPAGSSDRKRDETGIVVVGKRGDQFYVLEDLSGHYSPEGWAAAAWKAFDKYQADRIVAEKNYGGEMVKSTLRNARPNGNVELVWSRRGKVLRAEPIVSLYEQERVHHFERFEELETQMTEWVPATDNSPDRVDALVHGLTALNGGAGPASVAIPRGSMRPAGGGFGAKRSGYGYTPREAQQVVEAAETIAETAARIADALGSPETFLPKRFPCKDGEHPGTFESHHRPGVNVCSRCLHDVEDAEAKSPMAHAE